MLQSSSAMPDACINLTEAARAVQTFRINAFTATKEMEWCTASSEVWPVGGLDWRIDFQPNIRPDRWDHDDWIRFRVNLISDASEVAASFSCFLVDPTTTERPAQSSSKAITKSSIFSAKSSYLEVLLTTRHELEGSSYLKDDKFLVQCEITVLLGGTPTGGRGAAPPSDLQKHFGELLQSQNAADITFLVAGESVPAHRFMLAARSPVFMAELFGDMKENSSPSVEIEDMDVDVFKAMLHYIYTDRLPELEEHDGEEQATLMAQHLLDAADRYGLERLKGICVDKLLRDGISVETVATTLALADRHGCSELKARCTEFILSTPANLCAVAATEGYKHLEASCPSVLTGLLKLAAAQGHKQ